MIRYHSYRYKWTSRKVLDNGVIANIYEKDGNKKTIIINYTDEKVSVSGTDVEKKSAAVIEGGVE